ncbi:MAG: BatD family protein [Bdellovibrionaceae bacterium]|nr:BatD family protein [Pseudobdellovibrionaceae bacterium]
MKRIGKTINLIFVTLILLWCGPQVWAQEITTELAESAVGVDDVFSIVVKIKKDKMGSTKVEVPRESRPQHRNMAYLRESQNSSLQTTIVQGQVLVTNTTQKVLTYHAQRKGDVHIEPFMILVDGKRVRAPGLQFKIAEKSVGIQGKKNKGASPFDSMESLFSNFLGRRLDILGKGQKSSELDFFVDVEVSNMNPYQGEQFVVQWYLYANGRITDIDSLKYPALEGFWKEEISLAVALRGEPVTRDGKDYTRYMLASYAVTPIVKDRATIDAYTVKCVLASLNSFFNGAPTKEAVRSSDEAILNIKPLPEPKPDDFSGLVGEFQLQGSVDRSNITVGQPFTYKYRVAGIGQSKFMNEPQVDFGPDFEVYDVAESSRFVPPNRTEKVYSYLLVPKNLNANYINSFSSSFFDPEEGVYYTLETRPFSFNVEEGAGDTEDESEGFFKTDAGSSKFQPTFYEQVGRNVKNLRVASTWPFVVLYSFGMLLVMMFLAYQHFAGRIVYNFEKDLQTRFEHLFKLVDDGHWREASVEAVNIVYFFVNSRSRRISRSQRLEDIMTALPPSLRREIEAVLADLNHDLQRYSFAPASLVVKGNEKDQVKEKCLALQRLFERSLRDEVETS